MDKESYDKGFLDGLLKAMKILDAWKDEYGIRALQYYLKEREKDHADRG